MNKYCKQYISDIKTIFPIMGKSEKKYIASLASDLEDCCDEESIESIDILYTKYGTPAEVVNNYFSIMDTDQIIKKIRMAHFIKMAIFIIMIIMLVASVCWEINLYNTYKIFESNQPYSIETTITD